MPYQAYSPHRQAEKERIKNQKHGDLRMVILRREEFSSSELNVGDVSSNYPEQAEPRTASLWGECSNSWAIMQEEDKSHQSSNEMHGTASIYFLLFLCNPSGRGIYLNEAD